MIRYRNIKMPFSILLVIMLLLLCAACDSSRDTGQSTISDQPVKSETENASRTADSSIPGTESEPEAVSSVESNIDNASDAVVLNPETPGMTSSQENELIEAGNERQEMFGCATAMES